MKQGAKDSLINLIVMGTLLSAGTGVLAAKSDWKLKDLISFDVPERKEEKVIAARPPIDPTPWQTPRWDDPSYTPGPCPCTPPPTPTPSPTPSDPNDWYPPPVTPTPDTSGYPSSITITFDPFV